MQTKNKKNTKQKIQTSQQTNKKQMLIKYTVIKHVPLVSTIVGVPAVSIIVGIIVIALL